MAETGKIDFRNKQYANISAHINSLPEEDRSFAREYIISSLAQGGTLASFHKENGPYAAFRSLREMSVANNEKETEETKKVRDPQAWWQNNGAFFGLLLSLDSPLAVGLAKEGLADGLPAQNGRITVYQKTLKNPEALSLVRTALRNGFFSAPQKLGTFLETAAAFVSYGKIAALREIIMEKDNAPLEERAGRALLFMVAEDMGIEPGAVASGDLSRWNLAYLPNLVSNDAMMESRIAGGDAGMENTRELYRAVTRATFRDRFGDFLVNENQDDEVGKDVARHNAAVRGIFEKNGINYSNWLYFKQTRDFLVSTEIAVDKTSERAAFLKARAEDVIAAIAPLREIFTPREYEPLLHLLEGAGNKKGIAEGKEDELRPQLENLEG